MTDLSVRVGQVTLKNPVLTASGCFGYGLEYDDFFDVSELGGICTKGLSLKPRPGNPPPRLYETPAGMINSIGLPNKGLEGFLAQDLPQLTALPVPLCVSVMATGREGFARLVEAVGGRDEVAAIELNVSCPNVKSGLIVGEQPSETLGLCEALRPLTSKPLVVKLNESNPALGELEPPHSPSDRRPRLRVAFGVNADRWLCATVEDLHAKRRLMTEEPVIRLL